MWHELESRRNPARVCCMCQNRREAAESTTEEPHSRQVSTQTPAFTQLPQSKQGNCSFAGTSLVFAQSKKGHSDRNAVLSTDGDDIFGRILTAPTPWKGEWPCWCSFPCAGRALPCSPQGARNSSRDQESSAQKEEPVACSSMRDSAMGAGSHQGHLAKFS